MAVSGASALAKGVAGATGDVFSSSVSSAVSPSGASRGVNFVPLP